MRGHKEMYRLRIGNWRLIYGKFKTGNEILSFGKRDDQTYRDF
jgi:mRNA-degrading endonuclease RelE of RelBE toxin-antitoxin system